MRCPRCGSNNPEGQVFCSTCDLPLNKPYHHFALFRRQGSKRRESSELDRAGRSHHGVFAHM